MSSGPPPWTVLFYEDDEGREPVREWLDQLERTDPSAFGADPREIRRAERFMRDWLRRTEGKDT